MVENKQHSGSYINKDGKQEEKKDEKKGPELVDFEDTLPPGKRVSSKYSENKKEEHIIDIAKDVFNIKTPKEQFEEFLLEKEEKLMLVNISDYKSITIRTTPHPDAFLRLSKKMKYGNPSMLAETSIIGFGYNKLYTDIKTLNLVSMRSIIRNIMDHYNVDEEEIPKLSTVGIVTTARTRGMTLHCDPMQHSMLVENAELLGIYLSDLAYICTIYTFNHYFKEDAYYKDDFAVYYSDKGYIQRIRCNIERLHEDLVKYIVDLHYDMYIQLQIEELALEKGLNTNKYVNTKRQLIDMRKLFKNTTEFLEEKNIKTKLNEQQHKTIEEQWGSEDPGLVAESKVENVDEFNEDHICEDGDK